jgi:hypothetical protein
LIVVCVASGHSLTKEDVEYCKGKAKVYIVNDGYKLAPWADLLYAAHTDRDWETTQTTIKTHPIYLFF